MVEYIKTKYVCNQCDATLIYEDYGNINSTMMYCAKCKEYGCDCKEYKDYGNIQSTALYCKECKWFPALTKDGKKTDTSKLHTRL